MNGPIEMLAAELGTSARYVLAGLALLLVGGGARWWTRSSLRKAEPAIRGRAGRSAFLSSGILAAVVAYLLGGQGLGLGQGGGEAPSGAGGPSGDLSSAPASAAAEAEAEPEPVKVAASVPSRSEVELSIENDRASGRVRYLIDGTPVEPGEFSDKFLEFYRQNPKLKEVRLSFPEDAAAADVLAIQRVISSYPTLTYAVGPAGSASAPASAGGGR